ncbi:hypothetical protein OG389_13610 [Streptomyces sp. NBC_00435]|uniref:hypothetical protein n=1 Tax=Streptomyces sp. NBC_00435 TaxID=2903649 RepID=UPI002E23533A
MAPQHGDEGAARAAGPAAHGIGLLALVERTLGTGTAAYLPGGGWIRLTLPLDDGGGDRSRLGPRGSPPGPRRSTSATPPGPRSRWTRPRTTTPRA